MLLGENAKLQPQSSALNQQPLQDPTSESWGTKQLNDRPNGISSPPGKYAKIGACQGADHAAVNQGQERHWGKTATTATTIITYRRCQQSKKNLLTNSCSRTTRM